MQFSLSYVRIVCFILFFYLFYFLPRRMACGILVPQPGTEPGALAVKAPSPNHWTAREFPGLCVLDFQLSKAS